MSPFETKTKTENEIASDWLLFYPDLRKDYLEQREEIIHSKDKSRVLSQRSRLSNPRKKGPESRVEFKARCLFDELHQTELWIKLIEKVEQELPERLKVFLNLRRKRRYARGRNGWTAAVQAELPENMWIESRNTFTFWWKDIVNYTVRQAIRNNLL